MRSSTKAIGFPGRDASRRRAAIGSRARPTPRPVPADAARKALNAQIRGWSAINPVIRRRAALPVYRLARPIMRARMLRRNAASCARRSNCGNNGSLAFFAFCVLRVRRSATDRHAAARAFARPAPRTIANHFRNLPSIAKIRHRPPRSSQTIGGTATRRNDRPCRNRRNKGRGYKIARLNDRIPGAPIASARRRSRRKSDRSAQSVRNAFCRRRDRLGNSRRSVRAFNPVPRRRTCVGHPNIAQPAARTPCPGLAANLANKTIRIASIHAGLHPRRRAPGTLGICGRKPGFMS